MLFGDGAGALVFRATDRDAGLRGMKIHTDGRGAKLLYVPGGGFRTRPYWKKDHFDEQAHIPRMDGKELFKFAVTKLPEAARALCKEKGVTIDQIDWFLAHQANQRINEYVREHLEGAAREDADEHRPVREHERSDDPDPHRRRDSRRQATERRA